PRRHDGVTAARAFVEDEALDAGDLETFLVAVDRRLELAIDLRLVFRLADDLHDESCVVDESVEREQAEHGFGDARRAWRIDADQAPRMAHRRKIRVDDTDFVAVAHR